MGASSVPRVAQAVTSPIYAAEGVVTGFNSWMGVANPGGADASELGNRLTFAVSITGTDNFYITDSAGSYNYSSDYEGVIYTDGKDTLGGVTYVTSGANM